MTITHNGAATASGQRVCVGPLACYIDRFAEFLVCEGYPSRTVKVKRALVADLSRWLARRGLPLARLDEQRLKQFHAYDRRSLRRGDVFTGHQLLEFLRRRLGVISSLPQKMDRTALDRIIRDYCRFLSSERGLARATVVCYLPIVRRLLTERFGTKSLRLEELRPADLNRFILRQGRRVSRIHARMTVTALRSFLRFLRQRGAIKTDLAAALPGVAHWRLSHIPKSLPPGQVEQLLRSCDRCTPSGQRDYAILLLLARLGLRGGEVLAMTLDDLDWEHGEMIVRGKGQRLERLPLPRDVGTALVHYLRHVRPACSSRNVFIRLKAPLRGLRLTAICCVVRRALKRAGLDPDFKGAHLLRHSLATTMLRRGASLGEIGQLLRHKQPTTTQIYAKVDIKALRGIALPWMGGVS
ncbi:site-specific integrase [Bradyrhizobium sp. CCGUVB23]|uniref:site-specific integrase n=1 Tax=Bradyrhizobium sp. CCGUVB23 TaxID=2949630 RepID=UPI0020B3B6A1|nr:site-specific integrase [Bradyrhizobium sp. CCGUVB23]MCP3460810.1 site-specific integrase [Bradyrhizobium sp. CCGUVB23]MCP3463559.1 site-specific integrase [Bradyrhizobium sp. CCGUVB23]MCP3468156.1 site-specific integrase [Bradyrhizobium sp. CCGUVB23]